MTPEQCRAARAWLDMSQGELAKAAKVGLSTVKDFESGKRTPIPATQTAMRVVLERAGIGFPFALDDDGKAYACGITFSKPSNGQRALDGFDGVG
jgi:DNA-binding XRE family transcriptional regulator